MNKVYIIFPLIGLLIFGGFYLSFDKSFEAKLAQIKAKAAQRENRTKLPSKSLNARKPLNRPFSPKPSARKSAKKKSVSKRPRRLPASKRKTPARSPMTTGINSVIR